MLIACRRSSHVMRSVPPRGSGWVLPAPHSTISELATHPPPRGGTDITSLKAA